MIIALLAIAAPNVVALEDDGPAWAELRIALPGGASDDPKEKSGLAHVASLMLERRSAAVGGRAHLGRRSIALSAGAPTGSIESVALELIDGIARDATTTEVDAAVRLAAERRRRFADDDRALAEMELMRALGAPDHSLGSLDEIATITRDDVASFQRRFWSGARILVVLSGRFDEELPKKLEERLAKLDRPAAKDTSDGGGAKAGSLRVLVIDKPNRRRAHVAMGRRVDGIDLAKIAANAGLGGSMSGRLTASMQRTPVAGAYAFSTLREEHLVLWSAVKPEQVAAAIKRMMETLGDVAKKGLTPEEIALGKIAAAARAELTQRDAASRADAAVRAHLSSLERDQSAERFLELSDDAVKRASQSLARSEGLAIVIVGSATADLQAALLAIPGVKEVQVARYDLR